MKMKLSVAKAALFCYSDEPDRLGDVSCLHVGIYLANVTEGKWSRSQPTPFTSLVWIEVCMLYDKKRCYNILCMFMRNSNYL